MFKGGGFTNIPSNIIHVQVHLVLKHLGGTLRRPIRVTLADTVKGECGRGRLAPRGGTVDESIDIGAGTMGIDDTGEIIIDVLDPDKGSMEMGEGSGGEDEGTIIVPCEVSEDDTGDADDDSGMVDADSFDKELKVEAAIGVERDRTSTKGGSTGGETDKGIWSVIGRGSRLEGGAG